jgi:hypothetical protein
MTPAHPLSEAELAYIWQGQRYPPGALSAAAGPVRVLFPGRRAGGAGPDFRDAVIEVAGRQRRGDVELHVRASNYLQHGHHLDAAYDSLVLHVVFEDDAGGWSPLPCGERVPVAAFAPWVRAREADIAAWLQAPPLWREPCQGAAAHLGEGVRLAVRAAGEGRFRARVGALGAAVAREGEGEALWQALLEALGYGGDRQGFVRLARALPAALLREVTWGAPDAEEEARAALMAVAGLGSAPAPGVRGLPPALSPPLRAARGRPANRPEARLAAAACLFVRLAPDLPSRALANVMAARDARSLLAAWTVPARRSGRGCAGALGTARATELLLNAVLPFAAAVRPDLLTHCLDLAAGLPALPPYGKTAFLEANLAPAPGRRPVQGALDQQGLLALHAEWCSRGGCGRCPLS